MEEEPSVAALSTSPGPTSATLAASKMFDGLLDSLSHLSNLSNLKRTVKESQLLRQKHQDCSDPHRENLPKHPLRRQIGLFDLKMLLALDSSYFNE